MTETVELTDVRKTYRRGSERIAALDRVSLSISAGDFVAVVGPSGSGKTTLLNMIGCTDRPDSGSVRIDGTEVSTASEQSLTKIRGHKIGFVFQQFFLVPTLTVEENVLLPALFVGHGRTAKSHAHELLEKMKLSGRIRHLPSQLSGGEMQRVAIARALINNPRIVLADEPTGNLDSQNADAVLQILEELNSDGLSIVLVTHNLELMRHAKRSIHLRDGRIELSGTKNGEKQEPLRAF